MPAHPRHWNWEEAFDKFGFGDGDGDVFTETVAAELERHGFTCGLYEFAMHNTVIESIKKDGEELISQERVAIGYDNPREYLPENIVTTLDAALPPL